MSPRRQPGARRSLTRDSRSLYVNGRTVGCIECDSDGRAWLVKRGLDPERHQLRKPPSWAIDAQHIEELRALGGYGVRLLTVDGDVWEATLTTFASFPVPVNRGAGAQVALQLQYWTVNGVPPLPSRQLEERRQQLDLGFEAAS